MHLNLEGVGREFDCGSAVQGLGNLIPESESCLITVRAVHPRSGSNYSYLTHRALFCSVLGCTAPL